MRGTILEATTAALRTVGEPRFMRTERGFHGRFYCALLTALKERAVLREGVLLEMEYQKSARHGLHQRPDIVLHIPAEDSRSLVTENNLAVWALKRRATESETVEDFRKLDEMCTTLRYRLAIFVNIDAAEHRAGLYSGLHPNRVAIVAVHHVNGRLETLWGFPDDAVVPGEET